MAWLLPFSRLKLTQNVGCRLLSQVNLSRPLIAVFSADNFELPISDRVDLFHVSNDTKIRQTQDDLIQQSKGIMWVSAGDNTPAQLDSLIKLWPMFRNVTWIHSIFSKWHNNYIYIYIHPPV